ncbi:putative short chain oxidoreductase/dehydrogenase [Talaromyces proteolyticus]|uniref:3-oxoacyl-[acyl-carrier-protein] reductase n=1 Tax=Talaromyces proteolyticus TaxID=1131652 RepID=A0AAD4L1H0_9EURO|nr:putative short chain oxidoreductase/dehydrogenase [Talaromyces proteolyticus]KAH8704865.1 putative short chain oxidoreductase/dehydrogenase [Talaromyces proteolyticus]
MSQLLLGKAAIVTGGSRGLGAEIAVQLAKHGANVLISYNKAQEEAEKVAQTIRQLGQQAVIVQGGSMDRETPTRIVQTAVENYGKIDIIINNAGVGDDCLLKDISHDFWDLVYDTNVRMPAFLLKAALPFLGLAPRIVNISSIAARAAYEATSVYSSSKAALEGLTRSWAIELGHKYNATINCVNPGPIATDMMAEAHPNAMDFWNAKVKETPASPRMGTVDDVTQIVIFLCEDRSRWCTGSVINANGGLVPV